MKIRADLAPSGRGSQVKFCIAAVVVARSNAFPLAMQEEDAPQHGASHTPQATTGKIELLLLLLPLAGAGSASASR